MKLEPQNLLQVAKQLELLEETLIYRFLERIQFAYHPALYRGSDGFEDSLLGLRLQAHEAMEQSFGRYSVAEEFPFSLQSRSAKSGSEPLTASPKILQRMPQNTIQTQEIKANLPLSLQQIRQISQCDAILLHYLKFLAAHCGREDDMQYGSALEHDVMVLQGISRRVHFGALYVAEIKFCEQEAQLRPLILEWQKARQDSQHALRCEILAAITRREVEQRILQSVYDKTHMIQQFSEQNRASDTTAIMQRRYLQPESMRAFYADCIIPLTKEGELAYLYRRV